MRTLYVTLRLCLYAMLNTDGSEQQQQQQKLARQVIIQREERGYGFTVSGENPVYVHTVKESMSTDALC